MSWEHDEEDNTDLYLYESDEEFEDRILSMRQARRKQIKESDTRQEEWQIEQEKMFAECRGNGGVDGRHEMYLSTIRTEMNHKGEVIKIHELFCRQCGAERTSVVETGTGHWKIGKKLIFFDGKNEKSMK